MPTDHQMRARRERATSRVCAKLRPTDGDVSQQDAQLQLRPLLNLDQNFVRDLLGLGIDVASHRDRGGQRLEVIEHAQVSDVAPVKNIVGTLSENMRRRLAMRETVRVRDNDQTQRAVLGELDRFGAAIQDRTVIPAEAQGASFGLVRFSSARIE